MRKLLIIKALLTIWTCVAFAQEDLIWTVNDFSVRTGSNANEMNKKEFTYVGHTPEENKYFILNLPTQNGMDGYVKFAKHSFDVLNFTATTMDGYKSVVFSNLSETITIGIVFGRTEDVRAYQDIACITFYEDSIVIQYIYTLKRLSGFD